MADKNTVVLRALGPATPIAELTPDTSQSSIVQGVITIVWPYNKVKNSIAFILAEPEFRLRRAKGQVRVNFVGSSARAISECGLGSGDHVRLSLEGAEFVSNDAKARIPGTEVDWQLNFSERVVLQVKLNASEETKSVDVDHPKRPETPPTVPTASPPILEIEIAPIDLPLLPDLSSVTPIKNASLKRLKDGEFESPAFVKRAKISYGSLFEDDIFEEDEAQNNDKRKERKRTRFSLNPGLWRYGSRSPSPESPTIDGNDTKKAEEAQSSPPPRPQMTDSECQTMELDFPGPLPTGSVFDHARNLLGVQQQHPLIQTGGLVDQGHQTFPMSDWAGNVAEAQPPFENPDLFGSTQSATPFDPAAGAVDDETARHQGWNTQPIPNQSASYPEFPLGVPRNLFVPSVEQPFIPISSSETGGVVDAGYNGSLLHPNPYEATNTVDGYAFKASESGERDRSLLTQPPSVYPDLEDQMSHQHSPVQNVLLDAPFVEPVISLAEETSMVPVNPFSRKTDSPSERAAINVGSSSWAAVNRRTASRSLSRPLSSRQGSGDGQTPQSAMVIDESDSDEDEMDAPLVDTVEVGLGDASVSLSEHAGRALAQATQTHFVRRPPPGQDVTEEDWEGDEHAYADHLPDRYDDEYDEDDNGGDYNTSTYLAPQDDEDDANDMDLQTQRFEPEFRDSEAESWEGDEFEEEQVGESDDEEDAEDREEYEDDSATDAAVPQQQQQSATRPAATAPVFINLLSDSDDDNDKPPPRPPPSAMPTNPMPATAFQTAAVSPDYGPDSDEEYEENDEDQLESDLVDAGESDPSDEDNESERDRGLLEDGVSDDTGSQNSGSEAKLVEDNKPKELSERTTPEASGIQSELPQVQETQNTSASESPLSRKIRTPSPQRSSEEAIVVVMDESTEGLVAGQNLVTEMQPRQDELLASISPEEQQQPDHISPVEMTDASLVEPEEVNQGEINVDMAVEETTMQPTFDTDMPAPPSPSELPVDKDIVMEETDDTDAAKNPTLPDTQLEEPHMSEATMMDIDRADGTPRQTSGPSFPIVVIDESELMKSITVEESIITEGLMIQERTASAGRAQGIERIRHENTDSVQDFTAVPDVDHLLFKSQLGESGAPNGTPDFASQPVTQVSEEVQQEFRDDLSEASSLVSQLQGDDALQAALRDEDSKYLDRDIQQSTVVPDATSDIADSDGLRENQSSSRHSSLFGGDSEAPGSPSRVQESEQNTTTPDIARDGSSTASSLVEGQRQQSSVPPPGESDNADSRAVSPNHETVPEHVNEAGIRMGSPEWTAKERHEHEEPNVRGSPFGQLATPATHKNEAGITVGSPERAAIERHQHLAKEVLSSSPTGSTPVKNEKHSDMVVDIPTRAVVEEHGQQVEKEAGKRLPTVKSTPARNKAHSEVVMGSPEKTAKRRSESKEVHESSMSDPSIRLARAAIASKNALHRHDTTSDGSRSHARSRSFQKSPTTEVGDDSVQLAKASLSTPSKTMRADAQVPASSPASSKMEDEAGSSAASKLKLVRHLRDDLQECTTLKVLRQHTGKSVDAMAVAMMTPPKPERAKGGPREYMMSFTVTDHSISPGSVAEVQLYRPHKESLPIVKTGHVVLLRNFTVVSLKGKGYGLRTNDGSSWAVFDGEDEPAQIKGPPVEYGDAETTFAQYLREWYGLLDEKAKQKLETANQKIIEAGRTK